MGKVVKEGGEGIENEGGNVCVLFIPPSVSPWEAAFIVHHSVSKLVNLIHHTFLPPFFFLPFENKETLIGSWVDAS